MVIYLSINKIAEFTLTAAKACGLIRTEPEECMTFESWAAFTAASAVLLIIPGPTVLLVSPMLWARAGAPCCP